MMDNDILKLLPKKAFDLISVSDTLKIGSQLTKSLLNKKLYNDSINERKKTFNLDDVIIVEKISEKTGPPMNQQDGEKILSLYFLQFFDSQRFVHLDFRMHHFYRGETFQWLPSKLYYPFSDDFKAGIQELYTGFYFDDHQKFEIGLTLLGIIQKNMSKEKKHAVIEIFLNHFGEGKSGTVSFSLKNLQKSFNNIFVYFLREDIRLNPEFALLGTMLVTLYGTLEKIPHNLNVRNAFFEVFLKYK